MKQIIYNRLIIIPILLLISISVISVGNAQILEMDSERSMLMFEGTSTLHSWDVEVTDFHVEFQVPDHWLEGVERWEASEIEGLYVEVPAGQLDGGRSRMNRDLRDALNAEENPEITFSKNSMKFTGELEDGKLADVAGMLTVAGEEREVTFQTEITHLNENEIESMGSLDIDMTNFGIDPPRALLGTIRTGEIIELSFHIIFIHRE
ncbi:YceI family protein [Rhodohalobacter sp. SW132]|nr:YceI family protein [Rhodohalobacter sp. SW132]